MKSLLKDQSWRRNCLVISFRWEVHVKGERNCFVSYTLSFSHLVIIESLKDINALVHFQVFFFFLEKLSTRFQSCCNRPTWNTQTWTADGDVWLWLYGSLFWWYFSTLEQKHLKDGMCTHTHNKYPKLLKTIGEKVKYYFQNITNWPKKTDTYFSSLNLSIELQ